MNVHDKIKWASNKKKMERVNSKGMVTAKSKGKVIITANYNSYMYSN